MCIGFTDETLYTSDIQAPVNARHSMIHGATDEGRLLPFFMLICKEEDLTKEAFKAFTALDCDRASFIRSYLSERGTESAVLPIEGRNHIYVKFPLTQYNPQFRTKTVIAHYDRAPGTPGANDNSAAVSILMDWATRLVRIPQFHNVRLIFTDGEEEKEGGVMSQGAFALAAVFRRLNINKEDIFVFDCVGRGTIPILASAPVKDTGKLPKAIAKALLDQETLSLLILRSAAPHHLRLPVPYSDNAGFIAQGIAAGTITFLPKSEAEAYLAALMREGGLRRHVLNMAMSSPDERAYYDAMLPPTWKLFHTMQDNIDSLTSESVPVMLSILDAIWKCRIPK